MSDVNAREHSKPEQLGGTTSERNLPVRPASPPGELAPADALF